MKRFLFGAVAALALALPSAANAACPDPAGDGNFSYLGGGAVPHTFGPTGQWNCEAAGVPDLLPPLGTFTTPFHVFCVERLVGVAPGNTYDAWATEISDVRFGLGTNTRQNSFEKYWEAAYIVQNYFLAGGTYGGDSMAWSWAIWGIMEGANYDSYYGGLTGTIRSQAVAAFALSDGSEFSEWYVITDVNNPGRQELIGKSGSPPNEIVPEPATMSLLAMGLAGMAGAGMRRRKQAKR